MTDLVERLVPDELWVLFRRVVPPTVVRRPQGGGQRRAGDREVLAAVIFVATSGCTWRQLPPVFGPAWQTGLPAVRPVERTGSGPGSTAWSRTSAEPGASWTGRGVRSTPSASRRQMGASDRTESDRPWQVGIENPSGHRPERTAAIAGYLRRQHARRSGAGTALPWNPAHPFPPWAAPQAAGEAACGQTLRLRPPAAMTPWTRHTPPHRPERRRVLAAARPPPLGRGKSGVVAGRLPTPTPPLRTQARALPRARRHRRHAHLPPPPCQETGHSQSHQNRHSRRCISSS